MNYENLILPHNNKYMVAGREFATLEAAKAHVYLSLQTKAALDKASQSSSYNKDYTNYNEVSIFKQLENIK
jgi:hypothetical protein